MTVSKLWTRRQGVKPAKPAAPSQAVSTADPRGGQHNGRLETGLEEHSEVIVVGTPRSSVPDAIGAELGDAGQHGVAVKGAVAGPVLRTPGKRANGVLGS
jgi:hypothetical protein